MMHSQEAGGCTTDKTKKKAFFQLPALPHATCSPVCLRALVKKSQREASQENSMQAATSAQNQSNSHTAPSPDDIHLSMHESRTSVCRGSVERGPGLVRLLVDDELLLVATLRVRHEVAELLGLLVAFLVDGELVRVPGLERELVVWRQGHDGLAGLRQPEHVNLVVERVLYPHVHFARCDVVRGLELGILSVVHVLVYGHLLPVPLARIRGPFRQNLGASEVPEHERVAIERTHRHRLPRVDAPLDMPWVRYPGD
mmetsp:Transcript_8339/g.15756  ORF Transcript_8339/g.15756 Transcript_8339/m.15756 type:complete len:256 (+) Transcript_8339:83-850(+)